MGSLDIAVDEASLVPIHFEPAIGMIFTQHTGDKFFGKYEIVEKMDRNIPALLGCEETSKDGIGVCLGLLVWGLDSAKTSLNDQTFLFEGRKSFALFNEIRSLVDNRLHQVRDSLPLNDHFVLHPEKGVVTYR